jgi:hypothetical protein
MYLGGRTDGGSLIGMLIIIMLEYVAPLESTGGRAYTPSDPVKLDSLRINALTERGKLAAPLTVMEFVSHKVFPAEM